ncbi:hypothetical protein ACSBR2_037678 [Camellia fascicularis]
MSLLVDYNSGIVCQKIHKFSLSNQPVDNHILCRLLNASICKARSAIELVALATAAGLGALIHTLGTLIPVIGVSGFATVAATTVIGTVVGSFR